MASRKNDRYLLTINNYQDYSLDSEKVKAIVEELEPIYACYSEEIGEQGTPHIHLYLAFKNYRSFNTIKKAFDDKAHIDASMGTHEQNRDYVFKIGKWLESDKSETNNRESHWEIGECPKSVQGSNINNYELLRELINQDLTASEIVSNYPQFSFRYRDIELLVNKHVEDKFKEIFRDLEIVYIYGTTGSGKSRFVMEQYGYSNVYRITDAKHPWDNYNCQPVVLFEEFRGDYPCKEMLYYLDGYPIELPCRYSNKYACFTKVFICTNIPIEQQYLETQRNEYETYQALLRRIKMYMCFNDKGKFVFKNYEDYKNGKCIELKDFDLNPLLV